MQLIYADRMRTEEDKENVLGAYKRVFPQDRFPIYEKAGTFFIHEKAVQLGRAFLKRKINGNEVSEKLMEHFRALNGSHFA